MGSAAQAQLAGWAGMPTADMFLTLACDAYPHTRVLCRHADCSVPQEAPDEVIDSLLQDQAQSMHLSRYSFSKGFS